MNPSPEYAALDRAELEVNRVLEQIGRVFAATKTSHKGTALAVATRMMKQVLPVSANQFHSALDELDQQLQLAKSIMRRDLALLTQNSTERTDKATKPDTRSNVGSKDDDATDVPEAATDTEPSLAVKQEPEVAGVNGTATNDSEDILAISADPSQTTTNGETQATDAKADIEMTDSAPLKIVTSNDNLSQPPTAPDGAEDTAEKAPDTAFSANADMDSLFNDPLTAGTRGDEQGDSGDNMIDFGNEASNADDFDFGVFASGDQDGDMSTLDLGLQSFENGGDGAQTEPDFNALFGPATDQEGGGTDGMDGGQLDADQIFNFDDLMDLGITNNDGSAGGSNTQDDSIQLDLS